MVLTHDGEFTPKYKEQWQTIQAGISTLQMEKPNGLVRYNAVKQLLDYCSALADMSSRLAIEEHISLELPQPKQFTCEEVRAKVNDYFKVDINEHTRKREVCDARHGAAYLCKMFTGASLKDIAAACGQDGKGDHTTAIHAIGVCKDLMDSDEAYAKKMYTLIGYFKFQK